MKTEYHGFVGATKHFEVYRTRDNSRRRSIRAGEQWSLNRGCAPGSSQGIEGFATAQLAMAWGSKLNPNIIWKKVSL